MRIDVERGKARRIAFDHEKLMAVTRTLARAHGLRPHDGYYHCQKVEEPAKKARQLTSYDNRQEQQGSLSKAQHAAQVTRDLAVVLVGRDLLARASELASLTCEMLEATDKGETLIRSAQGRAGPHRCRWLEHRSHGEPVHPRPDRGGRRRGAVPSGRASGAPARHK